METPEREALERAEKDLVARQRAELQRQADAGEIPNSQSVQMKQSLTRLQSRAFALEYAIKLYSSPHPPSESFESVVRFIHRFMNNDQA